MSTHTIKRTNDIASDIAQFLDETLPSDADQVEDCEVNEPENKKSMVYFWLKKDDLWYQMQVVPQDEGPESEAEVETDAGTAEPAIV